MLGRFSKEQFTKFRQLHKVGKVDIISHFEEDGKIWRLLEFTILENGKRCLGLVYQDI